MRRAGVARAGRAQGALTESQNSGGVTGPLASMRARVIAWLKDSEHHSVAQRIAGAAFLIRVVSAALIYLSQIILARWMGSHEFGLYVYVWTVVLVIGDLSDLGLATAAQRFVPEYAKSDALDRLRGFLSGSRWIAVGGATFMAAAGILTVRLFQHHIAEDLLVPLWI